MNSSATSLDPNDPGTFWTVQEYGHAGNEWGTQVSQIGISPTLQSLTSTTAAGTYGQGTVINVTANFDLPVNVTGTPTIALSDGAVATYVGGGGTTQLTFSYTTAYGETTGGANLNAASASARSGGRPSRTSPSRRPPPCSPCPRPAATPCRTPASRSTPWRRWCRATTCCSAARATT